MDTVCKTRIISGPITGFEIDDVRIIPRIEKVSINEIDITTRLTRRYYMKIPFIPSPMDSVVSFSLAKKMLDFGGIPLIFINWKKPEEDIVLLKRICGEKSKYGILGICVAPEIETIKTLESILDQVNVIALDSLHTKPYNMLNAISFIKENYQEIDVISGNVTNAYDTREVIQCGCDAIRVGMTNNSVNHATEMYGCGRLQGSTIWECSKEADKYDIPVIADGGIKEIKDIALSLALGASSVMMGKMFACLPESAAQILEINGKMMKYYKGMSRRDILDEDMVAESSPQLLPIHGKFDEEVEKWIKVVKIAVMKSGQSTVEEFRKNCMLELLHR